MATYKIVSPFAFGLLVSHLLGLLTLDACSSDQHSNPPSSPTPEPSPTPNSASPSVAPSLVPSPSPEPSPTPTPGPNTDGPYPYSTLSAYHLFKEPMRDLVPEEEVLPYQVISPLYSDHAEKPRFIFIPEGQTITFSEDGRWEFPEGTILIKNFHFWNDFRDPSLGYRLIETRLLIFEEGEWTAHTYLWNDEQSEASRYVAGTFVTLNYIDSTGTAVEQLYQVPNTNQCITCHSNADAALPIGVRTRQLNRKVAVNGQSINQLEYFQISGFFSTALPPSEDLPALANPSDTAQDLTARARSYLESNCAHCHQLDGAASASGLILSVIETNPSVYGVCKTPVATGSASGDLLYDIVPAHPEESILVYRMNSTDPEVKMPEIGTLTIDEFGVALVSEWIAAMNPDEYQDICDF